MSLTTETAPVLDQHRFDEAALERFMQAHVEGFVGPLHVGHGRGGMSTPTVIRSGANGQRDVGRTKPPGELLPSAHAGDRDLRVISALWETDVPVAKPYVLCQDPDVIGVDFYIMDFADGRVLRHLELPALSPLTIANLLAMMISM
jgi:aminoglycoside phosphotransferase (APT) family kinase protein